MKSNIFWVRCSLAATECYVGVTHVLRNFPLHVTLLHELTYRTTWPYTSTDAAHNSGLVQCPNLNHASSWAI